MFRLMKEAETANSAFFLTLTYADDNIKYSFNGYPTLDKADFQKFMKRLRKLNKSKLTYYAAGEYGDKTNRPHYHVILFNAEQDTIEKAWSLEGKPIGHVHFGDVAAASVTYSLKYINKIGSVPEHELDDREPLFQLMSKGIGKNYLTKNMRKWHKKVLTDRVYLTLPGGQKVSMPRYYKQKLYTEHERKIIGATAQTRDTEKWQKMDLSTKAKNWENEISIAIEKTRKHAKNQKPVELQPSREPWTILHTTEPDSTRPNNVNQNNNGEIC